MAPIVRFHPQPSADGDTAGEYLRRLLTDEEVDSLDVVVAWVRFRGLARLKTELDQFRGRGHSRIILGIDEEGASRPGLFAALRNFSEAYVYHDHRAGTFHPKVYLGQGPNKAHLLVGSSNMSPGGWFFNDEASLEAQFDLPADAEASALVGARAWIESLLGDVGVCRPLTEELIDELVGDPRYRVSGHERRTRRARAPLPPGTEEDDVAEAEEGEDSSADQPAASTFGTSNRTRAPVPGLSQAARDELAELEVGVEEAPEGAAIAGSAPPVPIPSPTTPTPAPSLMSALGWNKQLVATDAQHQPGNPTGNLRLTKARRHNDQDIAQATWFREELFGDANWTPSNDSGGNPIEIATVRFDVTIAGVSYGPIDLEVDHGPHRISDQSNHATILHWGPLEDVLRQTDYTGQMLTISRAPDGSYSLVIS